MREIRCEDGTRWRLEAKAETPADPTGATAPDADGAEVALLHCTTCDGPPRFVTIRAPAARWRELAVAELCRLIEAAERAGTATHG